MLIVVTGFGPFRGHDVNPSWEAVKALPAAWDDDQHRLVVEEIPVDYDFVLKEVPDKWSRHSPDFILHVGVSHLAEKLTLEKQANNSGYMKPDVKDSYPPGNCCVASCQDVKKSSCLDVEVLMADVNQDCARENLKVEACVSEDAGNYLCDFVYFKSLHSLNGNSLFVHVPEVGENKPYTIKQMTEGLAVIVRNVIKQVDK